MADQFMIEDFNTLGLRQGEVIRMQVDDIAAVGGGHINLFIIRIAAVAQISSEGSRSKTYRA